MLVVRHKKKFLFSTILVFLAAGLLLSFRGSEIKTSFPVPRSAELTKQDMKERYAEYSWGPASESYGLPFYYTIIIRLWGWNQEMRFGATTYYEKQGTVISATSLNNNLFISIEKE
ncbi:hypothetical protein RG959_21710 [Domibacillus sp. 8LH]|uniref:hypothetical protein n=1 Tax=Domibacillus sp. 8LH TaxID=3073900 RepID=UPI0031785C44